MYEIFLIRYDSLGELVLGNDRPRLWITPGLRHSSPLSLQGQSLPSTNHIKVYILFSRSPCWYFMFPGQPWEGESCAGREKKLEAWAFSLLLGDVLLYNCTIVLLYYCVASFQPTYRGDDWWERDFLRRVFIQDGAEGAQLYYSPMELGP